MKEFNIITVISFLLLFSGGFFFFSSVMYVRNSELWFNRVFASMICLGLFSIIRLLQNKK